MAEFKIDIPTEKIQEIMLETIEKIKKCNDIVRVVRCRDCRWYHPETEGEPPKCGHPSGYVGECAALFFCACGEQKGVEKCQETEYDDTEASGLLEDY